MGHVIDALPTTYFDLENYAHASLFEGCESVWEALDRMAAYLSEADLGLIEASVSEGAYLEGDQISIGEGSVVEPGVYIKGPCIIGRNCQIRHGAYIRGGAIIGDRCVVGHDTEVKGGIFLDGAQAAHFAYVGDSILGNRVNLGAGVKLANFKLSGRSIYIGNLDTGRRKRGAILGDGCAIGCNSVTNPGTVMGKNCRARPCTSIGGVIGSGVTLGNRYVSN